MTPVTMRQTSIAFQSKGRTLEGVVTLPQTGAPPFPGVVLCHGHTLFGGNMDSPLLMEIAEEVTQQGFACLRFNFRGVGRSEGQFTNGELEHQDVAAALKVMTAWPGVRRSQFALVGHSFGASTILLGLKALKAARALVLLSPPLSSVRRAPLSKERRPMLFLVGEKDRIVPSAGLQQELQAGPWPREFQVVAGADHNYSQREQEVAVLVAHYLSTTM